jgi:hypothetical protein
MKIGEMKFNNEKKYPDSLDFSITEKLIIERNKSVDSAVMVEIQKIAVEGGIETKFILNERNILNALKKQIPQKPFSYKCPKCGSDDISCMDLMDFGEIKRKYCPDCGQALDWSE